MSLIQGEEMEPAIVEKLAHPLVLAQDSGNCLGGSLDHDGEPQGVMGGFFAIVNALRRQPAPQRTAVTLHRTDTADDVMN